MIKKISYTIFIVLVVHLLAFSTVLFASPPFKVTVDGETLVFNEEPIMKNNTLFVPIDSIADAMNLNFVLDEEMTELTIDSTVAPKKNIKFYTFYDFFMDGYYKIELEDSMFVQNGTAFIPLRAFVEVLGADVTFDNKTKAISIITAQNLPLFETVSFDTVYPLLNDRLSIKMPSDTINRSLLYNGIMGTKDDSNNKTYLNLVNNAQSLLVEVEELYFYSTGDLNADANIFINEYLKSEKIHNISEVTTAGDIQYISLQPTEISTTSDTAIINSTIVTLADNTLVRINFYVNQATIAINDNYVDVIYDIINTIESGTRTLETSEREIEILDKTMTVSNGYIYYSNHGHDYVVLKFIKMVEIGQERSNFSIYNGNHPSESSVDLIETIVVQSIKPGFDINWKCYFNGNYDNPHFFQTIINNGDYKNSHIFGYTKTKEDWKAVLRMMHTLYSN